MWKYKFDRKYRIEEVPLCTSIELQDDLIVCILITMPGMRIWTTEECDHFFPLRDTPFTLYGVCNIEIIVAVSLCVIITCIIGIGWGGKSIRITKRHQYTPSPCLDTTNQGGRKIGRSCSTREVPSCHYYILCVQRWLQPATLIFELARVHTVCTWHKAKNVPSQAECWLSCNCTCTLYTCSVCIIYTQPVKYGMTHYTLL